MWWVLTGKMSYLIPTDYLMQIQPQLRAQINSLGMARAELTAIEEISGYLSKKYDVLSEFTDTALYNINTIYKAANRVYINYPAYVATNSYVVGNYVTNGNNAYVCNANTTGTFDASKWDVIGSATTLYYAAYPQPLFNIYGSYSIGDKVYWRGYTYTCKVASTGLSDFQAMQYMTVDNIPLNNKFPDDKTQGAAYWTNNGAYSVAANTLNSAAYNPTLTYAVGAKATYTDSIVYICTTAVTVAEPFNPAKWAVLWQIGDNRSQLMVTHMINIALYWAHYSIAPNNVPDDRRDAYGIAKEWCKGVMKGDITTPLTPIQPKKGQRILFDSLAKRGNSY